MFTAVLVILGYAVYTAAYIPAVPTNDTNAVNQTDMSMLTMKWAPAGIYSNTVAYQLPSMDSDGFARGALVHFSEKNMTDQNSTTPWIALVNCDFNTTNASQVDDIFTLARDRGAVAALLYSTTSEACIINPEYASPDNFEQILDIFATQNKSSATIILSQFTYLHNSSYGDFNALQLNNSAQSVEDSLQTSNVTSAYIVATLRSANSTVNLNATDGDNGTDTSNTNGPSRQNPNTGLAMIILYAITGCVSGLFIVVILSGAIRAIRHPERYGPRAAGNGNGPGLGAAGQSRTGGIGRAILDTFPIIKFGQGSPETPAESKMSDMENQVTGDKAIEMTAKSAEMAVDTEAEPVTPHTETQVAECSSAVSRSSPSSPLVIVNDAPDALVNPADKDVIPSAIGYETCPICIVDFEPGDDLRVLPCEGKHKFHQTCVDPWLLELSSSCPLCRQDFHALESMIAGEDSTGAEGSSALPPENPSRPPSSVQSSRFSKYLRFARRRNQAESTPPISDRSTTPPEDATDTHTHTRV